MKRAIALTLVAFLVAISACNDEGDLCDQCDVRAWRQWDRDHGHPCNNVDLYGMCQ
jgi:hypothetical protein